MAGLEGGKYGDSRIEDPNGMYTDEKDLEKTATTWQEPPHIDPAIEKRVTRKFDTHVVPWLFGLWLLAFIDRANIGNAKIDGLPEDIGLVGNQFNVALTIFYIPYICVDVPSNLILKKMRPGFYLPGLLLGWGLACTFQGFVKNYAGLLACRFFLGLFEGGLLGGMVTYLSLFYRRHQLMLRIGLFYCAAPLSGAFGGLLATGLSQISYRSYRGWPWIFFIEGIITVLYGGLTICFLPHDPNGSKFLSEDEKRVALARLRLDSQGAETTDAKFEKFDWRWVRMALLNTNTLLLSFNFFLIITPIYSYSLFLPTIITGLGYGQVNAQLLTVPPNMAAFFMVLLVTWASDRIRVRGYFMLGGITVAIGGYIMLISTPNTLIQYGGTFLVAAGIFPCSPIVMGWLANNSAPHYVRATATGFQIMVANFAAFIATFTYLKEDAPRYIIGHAINLGTLGAALMCTAGLVVYQKAENRKREQGKRDYRLQQENESMLGFRHPRFRYTI